MKTRNLGRTGLKVSNLCLGAMTFGNSDWGCDEPTSARLVHQFLDHGGNFIDTANAYTKGHSEAIIGDYLRKGSVGRDRIVIATKFFANLYPGDPNGGGASRKSLMAACDEQSRWAGCLGGQNGRFILTRVLSSPPCHSITISLSGTRGCVSARFVLAP